MKLILAEIITIGDEILYGQITDTNSQWISAELDKIGVKIKRKVSVSDQEEDILEALAYAEKSVDVVLITGGLGPTNDDLTKPCLAKYFNTTLEINEEALKDIESLFIRKGYKMTDINRLQASLPVGSTKITNHYGTAPGIWMERNGTVFVAMPGVPFEMKALMSNSVLGMLQEQFDSPTIIHKIIKTAGIGESWLAELIKDWEDQLPDHIGLAYLPGKGNVRLRLTGISRDAEQLDTELEELIKKVVPTIQQYIYGFGDTNLEDVIAHLLTTKKLTISLAESCTGGYISHLLTSIPGSSAYYMGSVVAYQNHVKNKLLGVDNTFFTTVGAVSEEVVKSMAVNVREKFNTDISIATSGIAGPGGATAEKPVGTIWLAISFKEQLITKKLSLTNDRMVNIKRTANHVLDELRKLLN